MGSGRQALPLTPLPKGTGKLMTKRSRSRRPFPLAIQSKQPIIKPHG
jgi:hypothetical protein